MPAAIKVDLKAFKEALQATTDELHRATRPAAQAGAVTSTVSASIRIRFRNDINAGMRVLAGATVYEIRAVLPEMGRREYVDLIAELVS